MRAAVGVMFALLLALSSRSQEVPEPMRWEGRTAAEWLVELRIGEVPARKRAAYAIWKLGPDAVADPAALRTVGAALTDGDDYVADLAGRILVRAGPAAKEAADEAVAALQDLRAGVRAAAVRAIRAGLPETSHAAASLLANLADDDTIVRRETAVTFGLMGYSLSSSGFGAQVVAGLADLLDDADAGVRREAAFALSAYGGAAVPAVRALVSCLGDAEAPVRAFAANTLAVIGPQAGPAALDGLYGLLGDADADVRARAFGGIDVLGADDLRLPPAMERGMEDTDARVRQTATWVLGQRFPERRGLRDRLLRAARDSYSLVRVNALLGLAKPRPVESTALAALDAGLRDPDPQVRATAARCVGEIGPAAARLTPSLIGMLSDTESLNDSAAMLALGRIGPAAREAVPDIRRRWARLRDPHSRAAAGAALARISTASLDPVVAEFIAVLRGASDSLPRYLAAHSLGEIGPSAAASIPHLRAALGPEDPLARMSAIVAIGRMGSAAAEALPELEALRTDASPQVARRAREAVEAIRGSAEVGK